MFNPFAGVFGFFFVIALPHVLAIEAACGDDEVEVVFRRTAAPRGNGRRSAGYMSSKNVSSMYKIIS
jgi:hypothetical protein